MSAQPNPQSSPNEGVPSSDAAQPSDKPLKSAAPVPATTNPVLAKTTQLWQQLRPTVIQVNQAVIEQLKGLDRTLEAQTQAEVNPVEPIDFSPLTRVAKQIWIKLLPLWRWSMAQIRARLSPQLNQQFSDRALSGILAGILILLFWIVGALPTGGPAQATSPRNEVRATRRSNPDRYRDRSTMPQTLRSTPSPTAQPAPVIRPTAQPVTSPVAQRPPVAMTPRSALESQLQAISNTYAADLLASTETTATSLIVTLTTVWGSLPPEQQDQFAVILWQQAKAQSLPQLELRDVTGQVLARSPVVGTDMVVWQRH